MGPLQVVLKTDTEITLSWSSLTGTQTGNGVITSYNLYWDNNSEISNILVSEGILTSFKVQGTVGGKLYKFKITATNVYGEGPSCDELTQLASDVPD